MTITLTREEAQQVLDALQAVWKMDRSMKHSEAIETLRARLAEPEPEPVAWLDSDGFPWSKEGIACRSTKDTYEPLYTASPQREWKGLTDEEISAVDWKQNETLHDFARAIEAKLKEKNA
jgi:hypothetical protein